MKRSLLLGVLFMVVLFVFGYTSWLASWTASYLPFSDNWKEHIVFTPISTQNPSQIYMVDMY